MGSPGVRVIVADNPSPLTLDGSRTYVVGGDPCLVIDPGPASAGHLDAVEVALGSASVAAVCVTHWHPDHAAGAAELVERVGSPLAASRQTALLAGLDAPGIVLGDGVELEFDGGILLVIAAPGHSPEHHCFYWPERRALFSGDAVLGEGTSMIAPPEGDMAEYMQTLARLSELELEVIYPGHGSEIEDAAGVLREYIVHRSEREAQVKRALAAGAVTVSEIRSRVYPELDRSLHQAAEGSVMAHLIKLIGDGRVVESSRGYELLE